jgi:hypothetical protein
LEAQPSEIVHEKGFWKKTHHTHTHTKKKKKKKRTGGVAQSLPPPPKQTVNSK